MPAKSLWLQRISALFTAELAGPDHHISGLHSQIWVFCELEIKAQLPESGQLSASNPAAQLPPSVGTYRRAKLGLDPTAIKPGMIMVHGQSQLNAVTLLRASCQPVPVGFHGLPSCSAPEKSGPRSPHSTLQLQVAPSQCSGGECALPFLNLSHSVSFLFRLRKSCKGKCFSNAEQDSIPCLFSGKKIPPGFCSKQNKVGKVCLVTGNGLILGLISQPLKSLKKFMPFLS